MHCGGSAASTCLLAAPEPPAVGGRIAAQIGKTRTPTLAWQGSSGELPQGIAVRPGDWWPCFGHLPLSSTSLLRFALNCIYPVQGRQTRLAPSETGRWLLTLALEDR